MILLDILSQNSNFGKQVDLRKILLEVLCRLPSLLEDLLISFVSNVKIV